MDQIIKALAMIANDLDDKGLLAFADAVDKIADTALDIKVAQYVGIQGYWIRNSRCWGNCLRQKKTSSPEKPSQEIWASCHKEYLESLGSPDSTWDKYAGSSEGMLKSASARSDFDNSFKKKIEAKVSSGADLRFSIVAALDEQGSENFGRLIEASSELVKMADQLSETDLEMSMKLAQAAADLSKTARFWHPADWMGGIGDWASKNRAEHANKLQQKAQDYMGKEQGRNNPFLGGSPSSNSPSLPSPSPSGGTRVPRNQIITGPNMSGGRFDEKTPMLDGGSTFDQDGNPASAPPPGGGPGGPGGPAASPSADAGMNSPVPESGPDGQITLQPMSALSELPLSKAGEYFKTLLKAQERINAQMTELRKHFSGGASGGTGESSNMAPPLSPEAATPSGGPPKPPSMPPSGGPPKPPEIPPSPSDNSGLPPGFSGNGNMGEMGQPSGPNSEFGQNIVGPKPRFKLSPTNKPVSWPQHSTSWA